MSSHKQKDARPAFNVGLIARLTLALVALVGSIAMAWTLLGGHMTAHASGISTTSTHTNPWAVAFDSSGNAWVAEPSCQPAPTCAPPYPDGAIEEFTITNGAPNVVHTYPAPTGSHYDPTFLQVYNGNVWFTDPNNNAIGVFNTNTQIWTEYTTGITTGAAPFGLVIDSNHNLWFAERGTSSIGYFNTSSHAVVETAVPTPSSQPFDLTYDSTHNIVWFTENAVAKIGNFTPTSDGHNVTITEYTSNTVSTTYPHMITLDSQGNPWYSEQDADQVAKFNPTTHTATQYSLVGNICPTPGVTPTPCTNTYISGIAVDANGTVWADEFQNSELIALNPTNSAVNTLQLQAHSGPGEGLAVDAHNNVWVAMQFASLIGEMPVGSSPMPTPTSPGSSPTTTPPTLPAAPVNPTWYFAEGHIGQGFQEYLTLDNPDTTHACNVTLTYLLSSGNPVTRTLTVGKNTRATENVNGDLGVPSNSATARDVSTIVQVTNTPTCQGVVAERPMYFSNVFGVSSGHDTLGATHLGTNFYFADVASMSGYRDFITILNPPGGQTAHITVTYYAGGNVLGTDTATVAPGTRGTITPHVTQHTAAFVSSDHPVMVERPAYFYRYNGGNAGSVSGANTLVGASALGNDWLFAEGYTGGGFQENFVIANLDTTANATASVTITLEFSNGSTRTATVSVPTKSVANWNVNALAANQNVSAEIISTGAKIVVERQMFFHYTHNSNGRSLAAQGGTDVVGQSGPASMSNYSFAEGYSNVGYDEWLTVQNPTANAETIWVTLVNGQGHTVSFSLAVGAHSRGTVDIVRAVMQHFCVPGAPAACWEISMSIQTADNSVFVAERPMYFNASGKQGGTDVIGYVGG
ncbi:MAG TPA: hypothetical protein VFA41_06045 [Ktedonobacteraceae bacterium]|nr:hypothetical protein [Ktedonobacteraceae bacterium]